MNEPNTGPEPTGHTHPLAYLAVVWVLAGLTALIFTWPTEANPGGNKDLSLLLLAVTLLTATVCGIGAAVLTAMRRRG